MSRYLYILIFCLAMFSCENETEKRGARKTETAIQLPGLILEAYDGEVFSLPRNIIGQCLDGERVEGADIESDCTLFLILKKNGKAEIEGEDYPIEGTYKTYTDEIIFTSKDRLSLRYFTIMSHYELEDEYGNIWFKE